MNERIQELAYEAEDYADSIVDQGGEFHPAYTRKLAELIIRECVQSIEKTIETNCDTDSEKMSCEFAITDMLEHFGVEE